MDIAYPRIVTRRHHERDLASVDGCDLRLCGDGQTDGRCGGVPDVQLRADGRFTHLQKGRKRFTGGFLHERRHHGRGEYAQTAAADVLCGLFFCDRHHSGCLCADGDLFHGYLQNSYGLMSMYIHAMMTGNTSAEMPIVTNTHVKSFGSCGMKYCVQRGALT